MTGTQLAVLASILSAFAAIIGIYYLARQNARENRRQRSEEILEAVRIATAPYAADIAEKDRQLQAKDTIIAARERRIEQLEDELRRAR